MCKHRGRPEKSCRARPHISETVLAWPTEAPCTREKDEEMDTVGETIPSAQLFMNVPGREYAKRSSGCVRASSALRISSAPAWQLVKRKHWAPAPLSTAFLCAAAAQAIGRNARICMGSAKQQAPGVQRRPSANSTTARPPLLDMPVARRCGPGKKKSQLYLLTETQETLFFCTQQGRRVDRQSPGLKVRTTRKSS